MCDCIRLEPTPASVATAREWSVEHARSAGFDAVVDTVELLVSELVTNAVRHAGTGYELMVCPRDDGMRVEVWDDDDTIPAPIENLDPLSTSGRGLALVEALADECGAEPTDRGGKKVWFYLKAREPVG